MNLDNDEEPFLAEELDGDIEKDLLSTLPKIKKQRVHRLFSSWIFIGINMCLILANLGFFSAIWNQTRIFKSYCPDLPYSPATDAIHFEDKMINLAAPNPYAGKVGSLKLNAAWEHLKIDEVFRVSREELERSNALTNESLQLEHGGYMAILRVFHEIHCLDWIKREYKVERPWMMDHLDHCLSALRQGAMCKADLSVGSFYWWPKDTSKRKPRSIAPRRCVNWDSLVDWLKPRRMRFIDGMPEAPVTPDGMVVDVVPTDGLHTLKDLGNDEIRAD